MSDQRPEDITWESMLRVQETARLGLARVCQTSVCRRAMLFHQCDCTIIEVHFETTHFYVKLRYANVSSYWRFSVAVSDTFYVTVHAKCNVTRCFSYVNT